MNDIAIETTNLTKAFPGRVTAVDGLTMSIPAGSVYGLIGRNGAGKTTLLRLLMGLLRPTSGGAALLGQDMWRADETHRARATYVSQELRLPRSNTLTELGDYLATLYPRWDTAYAADLADRFEIDPGKPLGTLSGGQQRKGAVLLAFAARPEVVLLDEPAAGLDPIARRSLIDEIVDMLTGERTCTVLFSTHIVTDLERVAEIVGIMDHGRIHTETPLEDLRSRIQRVQVVFDGQAVPDDFAIPGAIRCQVDGPVMTAVVDIAGETQLGELRRRPDVRVSVFPMGLEEMLIELLGPSNGTELHEELV